MSFILVYYEFLSSLVHVGIALSIMKLLEKKFNKYLIFVPIACILLCVPSVLGYGSYILEHIGEAIRQYGIVSEWSANYAKHMSYLYTDELVEALRYVVYLAINLIPVGVSFLYLHKLSKRDGTNSEIRKMKIKDL